MEELFTKYYINKSWGKDSESSSGYGSTNMETQQIKKYIVNIIDKYNINTFFDVPCGDFNWIKEIINKIPNYIGGDIVSEMITNNKKQYNNNFIVFDITIDKIPDNVELIFCRDLLVHFPLNKIIQTLRNIKSSKAKYLLTTTFLNRKFIDINLGNWRPLSLFNEPLNFPKPIELISENCSEDFPSYVDKSLGLWLVSDIPDL